MEDVVLDGQKGDKVQVPEQHVDDLDDPEQPPEDAVGVLVVDAGLVAEPLVALLILGEKPPDAN